MALALSSVGVSMQFVTALREALGISGMQQTQSPNQPLSISLSNGSSADQCSKFVSFTGSVTSGAPVSHDLNGGSTLIDETTKAAVAFSRVVGIVVINLSTATSDIFQVGLMMYRSLTGDPYFKAHRASFTLPELWTRIVDGKFPDRNYFLPHVPPRLRTIIRKALAVDHLDRYQDATVFANELGKVTVARD